MDTHTIIDKGPKSACILEIDCQGRTRSERGARLRQVQVSLVECSKYSYANLTLITKDNAWRVPEDPCGQAIGISARQVRTINRIRHTLSGGLNQNSHLYPT